MRARLAILLAFPTLAFAADPARAEEPVTDWKKDPVCQMVFFAVLEGLYADGVPDEVVDSVVPPAKKGDESVKVSFVIQCPLCHPVYEAFAQYQARRPAAGGDGERITFGDGIEPELAERLKKADPQTRLQALHVLVQRWVERRLTLMNLDAGQREDWRSRIAHRSNQGRRLLMDLIHEDPAYKGWSSYWGCAACNGSTDAIRSLKP